MSSEVVEISPISLGLGSAAAAAIIFGYLITGGYYEVKGLNEGKAAAASKTGGSFGVGSSSSSNKKLQAPFQWLVSTTDKKTSMNGNTQTIQHIQSIDQSRVDTLKYVGIGLVVIGWVLLAAAVSIKLTDNDAWSASTIGVLFGSILLMGVITIVNMTTINSTSKPTRFLTAAAYSLLWLGFGFYIGVCDSAGFDIEWDRAILGLSGGFLIAISQLFVSSDSSCCDVGQSNQEQRSQGFLGGTRIDYANVLSENKNASSAGVFSLGMPLYCMGWFMVVFAIAMR